MLLAITYFSVRLSMNEYLVRKQKLALCILLMQYMDFSSSSKEFIKGKVSKIRSKRLMGFENVSMYKTLKPQLCNAQSSVIPGHV